MLTHFKKLGQQVFIYGSADTINKLISVLIIPLFTRYFTPAEYGVLGILVVTTPLILILCDLGLTNAFVRFFNEEEGKNRFKLVSTMQLVSFVLTGTLATLVIIYSKQFSWMFFKTEDYYYAISLNFAAIPLSAIMTAPLLRLRMENKAKTYAGLNLAKVSTGVLLNVLFVVFLKKGINGFLFSNLINVAIYAVVITYYSVRLSGLKYSHTHFKKMLVFGLPFVLGMISFWGVNWLDRFVLSRLSNLTEVGLYTLGYTIGMAVMLPIGAFNTAWPAFYMSVVKNKNAKRIYALSLTYFLLAIIFFVLFVVVFARDYFEFFTQESFHGAYSVVPLISLAYVFSGVFSVVAVGLFISKKTIYEPISESIALVVNLALMILLIPTMGRMGAAWATLAAFFLIPVLDLTFGYRFYPIKYEYVRIIKIFLVGGGLYFLAETIYQKSVWNMILRLGIILAYPVILYLLNFFTKNELVKAQKFIAKISFFKSILRRKNG